MERRHRACKDPAANLKSRRAKNRNSERVHPWNPFIRQGCCWHWMASTRGLAHPFGGMAPTMRIASRLVFTARFGRGPIHDCRRVPEAIQIAVHQSVEKTSEPFGSKPKTSRLSCRRDFDSWRRIRNRRRCELQQRVLRCSQLLRSDLRPPQLQFRRFAQSNQPCPCSSLFTCFVRVSPRDIESAQKK
jgi:hypothetical protein